MFSVFLRKPGNITFRIDNIENFDSPKKFEDAIVNAFFEATGGRIVYIDHGWREPCYKEKFRHFHNKNEKKMTIDLFKSSNGPIEFFKGKEIFDCLEEIWEYTQEEKDKIIWSNPRNF